jgi:hypothetical protein
MRIKPAPFGLAFGIVYAVVFFLYGILAVLFGWGAALAETIGSFYVGFGPTAGGALIGALWASSSASGSWRSGPGSTTCSSGSEPRAAGPETRAFGRDWLRGVSPRPCG